MELALSRTPMVVAYRVGTLTYVLARWLFSLPYFSLVNLLLDRMAVPEFLQVGATPEAMARAVAPLFMDKEAAARQVAELALAARDLGEGGEAPSIRAARAIVAFARRRTQRLASVM
jgi:lipid-A-disaccharide synthase